MITKTHINRTKIPRTQTKLQRKSVKKKKKKVSCDIIAFKLEKITYVKSYNYVPDESETSFTQVFGNVVFKFVASLLTLLVISSVLFVFTSLLNIVVW